MIRAARFNEDHDAFRDAVRRFVAAEVVPHLDQWRQANAVPGEFFVAAAEHGLLGIVVPEQHGGGGVDDLRFVSVVVEEMAAAGSPGLAYLIALHSGVCAPLLVAHGVDSWLAQLANGTTLAVPLPSARADGVAGGAIADLFVTWLGGDVAVIPAGEVNRTPVDALGAREAAIADVRVENAGTGPGLIRDIDLWSSVVSVATARAALRNTVDYVTERVVFGRSLATLENTRFRLAECAAALQSAQLTVDHCLLRRIEGNLDDSVAAAGRMVAAAAHDRVVDCGLQLHGGYGYMKEYPIAQAFADARQLRQWERTYGEARDSIAHAIGL